MTPEALINRDLALLAWELRLLWAAVGIYGVAFALYIAYVFTPKTRLLSRGATAALVATAVLQTVVIILRTVLVQRPPFQSLFESLSWFSWSAVVAYLIIEWRRNVRIPGFIVTLFAGGAALYALLGQDPSFKPLFPALQSPWFFWHVSIAFASYAVFVVAVAVELSYLLQLFFWRLGITKDYGLTRENISRFHRSVHQLVLFGFPMLTFGIMSGAAWANEAWGVYWQWDPKETWSLITWFAFALYLHTRVRPSWRGAPSSVIMILAFLCMVTTFIGVSWLAKLFGIPSLHVYG